MRRREFIRLVAGAANSQDVDVAMSTNLNIMAVRPLLGLRLRQVKERFAKWRRQMRSRAELINLSDRCLQDIGMSRCTADFEASKPFWMA